MGADQNISNRTFQKYEKAKDPLNLCQAILFIGSDVYIDVVALGVKRD